MSEITFRLNISPDEYLAYYRGDAQFVHVTALDGRTVQFPANVLRPFVTRSGIQGVFVLRFDAHRRFMGIDRIE